jgi:hypothetical protein
MSEQILASIPDTIETPPVNFFIRHSISNKLNPTTDEDAEKCTFINDSDNDSFDDEEETVAADLFYSSLFANSTSYTSTTCPICFESSILQSALCCNFRCCSSCWRAHISCAINDGRVKIICASNECNKYLVRETIVNFIRYDSTLHERYLKLYANVNQNPRAKTCKSMKFIINIFF